MMYTGERLVPDRFGVGERIMIEHIDRYRFATQVISTWGQGTKHTNQLDILDAPCGVGYGAALLGEQLQATVVGIDNDQQTIDHARRFYYSIPKIEFHRFDLDEDQLDIGAYDVVVCFEGIEHVQKQDVVARKLCRSLRSPGLILVSTPRRDGPGAGSAFHTRELMREELYGLFAPYLVEAQMYGQDLRVADRAADADPRYFVLVGKV